MKLRVCFGILLSFSISSEAFAVGGAAIGNEVLSARAAGQGHVGIAAQNDDPITVYSNPAGLTSLKGTQVTLGGAWENLHGYYENDAGPNSKMRSIDAGVPDFAISQSLMDGKVGAGLGVISPYGLETHWPGDGSLRYVATNTRLNMLIITPAVAVQVHPMVSIGVGADYVNVFNAELEKNVSVDDLNTILGVPTAGAADADEKVTGTAANWGYHAGVTFQPNKQNSFGIAYHSKIKLNINGTLSIRGLSGTSADPANPLGFGTANYNTSAFTDLYLPQNIQFGYAFKPNEQWTLELDTAWYDWFSDKDLNFRTAETDPNKQALLAAGNPIPLIWRDTWNLATGANYKYSDKLQLRSGFWYQPWVEPESTFGPDLLDLTRYGLTLGAGYAFTPTVTVDLAYNAIFTHNRHITNTQAAASDPVLTAPFQGAGLYQDFVNQVVLNFTYKFGASH